MIPFSLELAKKGIPIKTRHGRSANFIAHLQGGQPAPLVVEIIYTSKHGAKGELENYYLSGKHSEPHESPLDLFMEY